MIAFSEQSWTFDFILYNTEQDVDCDVINFLIFGLSFCGRIKIS